jgi:multidrug efflux system membrane fusion protein
MNWKLSSNARRWLIFPPILLGVAVFAVLARNRRELEQQPEQEDSTVLSVVAAPRVDLVPRVLGYGTAEPGDVWRAVAEVRGRVVDIHPELEAGALIQEGQLLLKIDPTEYEIAIKRLQADIKHVDAQLAGLDAQAQNDRESLKIEESAVALVTRELDRLKKLVVTSAAAAQDVDVKEREQLVLFQRVQTLKNSLNLFPANRDALLATKAVDQAQLEQAHIDLGKTEIRAPFACRLSELQIEEGQFVSAGETLFEAHSTALTEVVAHVPIDQLRNLISPEQRIEIHSILDMKQVREHFQFTAIVRMRSGEFVAEWEGRFDRIREEIDPRTRTVGIVIAVDRPYEKIVVGERPPLLKGAFCEVELRGIARPGQIVIPRTAYWDGHVYVVDQNNRLRRQKTEIEFAQNNLICVRSGVQEGDRIVTSDEPGPLASGMLVKPEADEAALQELLAEAAAEGNLK